jgi:hypothetical protein
MPDTRHHRHIALVVLAWVVLSLAACGLGGEQTPPTIQLPEVPAGTCLIAPDVSLGTINPYVYGVNHGPWAVITDKTLPYAQAAGVTMIRFPGGTGAMKMTCSLTILISLYSSPNRWGVKSA